LWYCRDFKEIKNQIEKKVINLFWRHRPNGYTILKRTSQFEAFLEFFIKSSFI